MEKNSWTQGSIMASPSTEKSKPNGAMPPPPIEDKPNIPANDEFKATVEESKQRIQTAELPPPKRGGARSGAGRKPKVEATAQAGPQAAPPPPNPSMAPPDITAMIITPVAILGAIPARKTGIPELALTEHEAVEISKSLNGLLQAFIPDLSRMGPKTAACFVAGITIGSVALSKYAIYAEKLGRNVDKPVASVDKNLKIVETKLPDQKVQAEGDAPIMPPGGVDAMSVLRKDT